jgi:acetyl-CoA acyltransferase 1
MALRVNTIAKQVQAGFLTPQSVAGSPAMGAVGSKSPDDVVIVSALRTPIGRAKKGIFKDTMPDDLLKVVLEGVVKQSGINPKEVGDVMVGNVQLGGAYAGPARMAQLRAGFPVDVPIHSLNRQCSSGLQAVVHVANAIKAGMMDVGIGAGVESMTQGGDVGGGQMPPINLN